MKKILFIIASYTMGGGAESLLTAIVNHLDPEKYEISIIEFNHSDAKKEPVRPGITILDPIARKGERDALKKMYYAHRKPEALRAAYIPAGYDLYVSFNYQLPTFMLPPHTRNIAWIHGDVYDLLETGREDHRRLQDAAFEKARTIVAISDNTKKSIEDLFPVHKSKIKLIYSGIDVEAVRAGAKAHTEIQLRQPSLLFVGRLEKGKDPQRTYRVFARVRAAVPSAQLYYLGYGDEEETIRELSEKEGIADQVHFLGYHENPYPIIKQASVSCLLSRSEGFPMCLLESVALGVPFVATRIGGAAELSNGQRCGKVIDTDEEAVQAILTLLANEKKENAAECEKSIRNFSMDRYIARIEQLFDEVLSQECGEAEEPQKTLPAGLESYEYYYDFPTKQVPKGSKVVLYGAGLVGEDYEAFIKSTDYCELVCTVDKKRKNTHLVSELEYDHIVIAVVNMAVADEIRAFLLEKGVQPEKIVWERPVFRRDLVSQ